MVMEGREKTDFSYTTPSELGTGSTTSRDDVPILSSPKHTAKALAPAYVIDGVPYYPSMPLEDEIPSTPKIERKKPFMLPHWVIYIAWTLALLSIFGSAFFVFLYSLQWGKEKSEEWMTTFFLSFFQSVMVVQPLKVRFVSISYLCG